MITSRIKLEEHILKKCDRIAIDKEECLKYVELVNDKFNIPEGMLMDIIVQRVSLAEVSEFVLFCLLVGFDELDKKKNTGIYFTKMEIDEYYQSKYKIDPVIKFPICINCIQVNYDQWIGSVDVNFLMKLRNAQMINYNKNAQRTMQRIIRGSQEYYRITIDKNAVQNIRESYRSNDFIPNTITLNIPLDSDAKFSYDEKAKRLVINELDAFDISDGYHRYIAMCQEKDLNPEFNYNIELRIINFSDTKTKQFIFQEDQKTKMSKIDSESMNMTSSANIVLERLNQDVMFYLKGEINRNKGKVPFPELSAIVDYCYFKNKGKKERAILERSVMIELRNGFNTLIDCDSKYFNIKYDIRTLCCLVCLIKAGKVGQNFNETLERVVAKTYEKVSENKFIRFKASLVLFRDIQKIIEEEC